jgi:hypothetical protein
MIAAERADKFGEIISDARFQAHATKINVRNRRLIKQLERIANTIATCLCIGVVSAVYIKAYPHHGEEPFRTPPRAHRRHHFSETKIEDDNENDWIGRQ